MMLDRRIPLDSALLSARYLGSGSEDTTYQNPSHAILYVLYRLDHAVAVGADVDDHRMENRFGRNRQIVPKPPAG